MLLAQVLKKRLSMNDPSIMAGNFAYEEGDDLEPEEVAANARLLPITLESLPGGGLKHGTVVTVSDQAQDFSCQLVLTHKAGPPLCGWDPTAMRVWLACQEHILAVQITDNDLSGLWGTKPDGRSNMQSDWDEEKVPEGFILVGNVPATQPSAVDTTGEIFP